MTIERKPLFGKYNTFPALIISEITTYLEKRQLDHYGSVAGLCNSILSKNHYTSNFLLYFLNHKSYAFSWVLLLKNSFLFIINTLKTLGYETLLILIMKKKIPAEISTKLFVISFFNYDKLEKAIFDDLYLAGFQRDLIKNNVPYTFCPKLYHCPRNIFKAKAEFAKIKLTNPNFVTPYELLNTTDIFQLFFQSFQVYFSNVSSLRPWSDDLKDQSFNKALIENLKDSDVNRILYYITAKRIAEITNVEKVVLWYENQTIDKCIIRGLRKNAKIQILGCQFFLSLPQQMNLFPGLFEVQNNLCPDKIFTTQATPLDSHCPERYSQGVSLRYLYLKDYPLEKSVPGLKNQLALFLTFIEDKNQLMYKNLVETNDTSFNIHVKKHPAHSNTNIPQLSNWKEETRIQVDIILESEFVFSADSGVIFEAMALGRQVIILGAKDSATHFIPPEKYHGKLWLLATDGQEILKSIDALRLFREKNPSEVLELAQSVRHDYFLSNERNILEVLNIK